MTYKVNMENDCPFWAQQRMCNSNKCDICYCEDNEIPVFWRKQEFLNSNEKMFNHTLKGTSHDCP
jgi:hypothetical protein